MIYMDKNNSSWCFVSSSPLAMLHKQTKFVHRSFISLGINSLLGQPGINLQ